jgi:hypothetical protein
MTRINHFVHIKQNLFYQYVLLFCSEGIMYDCFLLCHVVISLYREQKVQKEKQRSTKHAYKTKDRVTRTSLKTGGELSTPER